MRPGEDEPGAQQRTLELARAAVERRAWRQALDLLDGDAPAAESPDVLELRAAAAYGAGDLEGAIAAWERLHAVLLAASDRAAAARAAAMIAMYLMMDTGLMAPVRGWLRRAERLLEGHEETPAHALIAMTRTYERFMCGDMEGARTSSALAIELGEQLGVQPAVIIGRVAAARVRIFDGDVAEGLDELDEVGALLMAGGADRLTTGMMYCELICAAQGLALLDRAREWTDVMHQWSSDAAVGGIHGRCRVHRAEMLRMSGPCDRAEEEALGACADLRPWMRREYGWPLAELGNIRLRKGDLAGATEAYLAAHGHSWSPHPGLALVRLEQGDIDAAAQLIGDAIDRPLDIPSKERPPFGDLRLAPLLEAQAEIAAAAGDLEVVEAAATRLRSIARSYPSRSLDASATLAEARAALLRGDVSDAIDACANATATWAEIGAPFESAVARLLLGDALDRSGNGTAAAMEWQAAAAAFEVFGAELCAQRARKRTAAERPARATASTHSRVTATFRRDGSSRTIAQGDVTISTSDLTGWRYIERMLADPCREFHVLDLVAVEHGTVPVPGTGSGRADDLSSGPLGTGLPILDDEARQAYRRRLADVDDDIEDARRSNDLGRLELAERDRDYLVAELSRAVGLGGRARTSGSTSERARTSVARSIRYSIARLAEIHPVLAKHLDRCICTGTYCRYEPDPLAPISWQL